MITAGTEWMPSCCQWRSRSRTSAPYSSESRIARGALDVEAGLAGGAQEHVARARVLGARVVRRQQRVLELRLRLARLQAGPVEQAMRVEGVPDPRPVAEREADRGAALAQDGAVLAPACSAGAPYLRAMYSAASSPSARQRRVELERLEMQLDVDRVAEPLEGAIERPEADRAPRAGDVGDEIDLHRAAMVHRSLADLATGSATAASRRFRRSFFGAASSRRRALPRMFGSLATGPSR